MAWQVIFTLLIILCNSVDAQLNYSIQEELKQGSIVGNIARNLSLSIKDLLNRKLQIVSRARKQYFNVNLQSGDLYIIERIDREELCGDQQVCSLTLDVVIENPLNFYPVKVHIQDVNDNSPQFSKNIFDLEMSEVVLPGTKFALGTAKDPDFGVNSLQGYRLSDNDFFKLGEKITSDGKKYPELVLDKPIDREKHSYFELILTAFDGGKPGKSGTALIKMKVHDINDNFPQFSQDSYQVRLNENAQSGFLILQLNATDEDEGVNAQITYTLVEVPQNEQNLFTIDPLKGDVLLIGKLDYEMKDRYELTVEAKDGGGLTAHCKVFIQVSDVNDNIPEMILTSLVTSLPEDSPLGTVIALVNIFDMDTGENGEVHCEILDKSPFQLIPSSTNYYKLVTSANLDRERFSIYNIIINAVDRGSPPLSVTKTLKLSISDVNDNSPVFEKTNYIIFIQENNLPGTSVCKISASDLDYEENAKIIYYMLINNTEELSVSTYISINSMTGVLYAQRSFDYEHLREFQFQVIAKDSGAPSLSSNVTVRICIIDKNDNAPRILYPSSDNVGSAVFEFIPHSAEKGYLVTKVIAVDADSGHNAWLSYHLLQIQDPSLFTIGQYTGEIRLGKELLDKDSLRHKIVVMVKDNGHPSLSSTVSLTLVAAENFQQGHPEIIYKPNDSKTSSNITFYLIISIALICFFFIVTVVVTVYFKYRKSNTQPSFGAIGGNVYPQFTLGCPSEISDTSLPFPFSYDVCVTLDSKQNEIAYLKPVQNVPTGSLIDTDASPIATDPTKDYLLTTGNAKVCNTSFLM